MKSPTLDRLVPVAVALILLVHAGVAIWAVAGKSVTADEILYVTGGHYIDRYGDYRIQPENGVLPQRLHGLAALLTDAPTPVLENNKSWRTSLGLANCYQFFYETGHDHFPMLMLARALNTLFSIGAGVLVFLWARHLAGSTAGLVAVTLYAADPNILAHAALATSDMAATFLLPASATLFWWQLASPTPRRVALSALAFGLACVAKFSAVLLIPVFAGLVLWRFIAERQQFPAAAKRGAMLATVHVVGAVAIIWLFHGFRYSGFSPALPGAAHYLIPWEEILPYIGWQRHVIEWCRQGHLLPEPFLWGYSFVLLASKARASFLAGETDIFGWVSFFPLAFAWKTTLALLAALALTLITTLRRWANRSSAIGADLFLVAPLLLFVLVYSVVSLASHLNIGHRHLLPIYPALFAGVGVWTATLTVHRWRQAAIVLVLGAHLAASAIVAPHFIAFFNRFAGGPANGYRLLVDSSLDWGQDLPGLRDWLSTEQASRGRIPVFLSYFGSGEPRYYGIEGTRLPFIFEFEVSRSWYEPRPGIYCISATMLQQVYSGFGNNWTPALEREYQQLRLRGPAFRDFLTKPDARRTLLDTASEKQWYESWMRFDRLRFARLCAQLRLREPDAMIGYSILIYRVNATELASGIGVAASAP